MYKRQVEIKGAISHQGVLGSDPLGNITRIDNVIDGLEKVLENEKAELYNTQKQLEIAKEQLRKPFSREDELKQKEARLSELNALLNVCLLYTSTQSAEILFRGMSKAKPQREIFGILSQEAKGEIRMQRFITDERTGIQYELIGD